MSGRRRLRLVPVLLAAAATLVALPGAGTSKSTFAPGKVALAHLSQAVGLHYWIAHPDQAPAGFLDRLANAAARGAGGRTHAGKGPKTEAFNLDAVGLPQNEESIAACRSNTNVVLGGTNDYRGLLNPSGDFTGWYLSTDGGDSLANEGFLPPVHLATGQDLPSQGDPVDVAGPSCNLYAGSLAFTGVDPSVPHSNAIAVYKTTAGTLSSCAGGDDFSCWPTRTAVAEGAVGHFLDKEWIDAGVSGGSEVVWVVWTDFDVTVPGAPFNASIMASRCSADLATCTAPQKISGSDQDVQFGDVTIGADGRTYITWSEIRGELTGEPQTFVHKLRIAPAGSTTFGPRRIVAVEDEPLPFGGFLHANDFRVATYPKNAVSWLGDHSRIFVVWDGCAERPLGFVCEEPQIKLTYSDNDGASWSTPHVVSAGGDNYFPTISDNGAGKLAVAWYTNRFDPVFGNAQDVELAEVDASSGSASQPNRLTKVSNETEADPLLGGFFIGDYFEVFADGNAAWVHFNANFRKVPLLGDGPPIPQQDNYLVKRNL